MTNERLPDFHEANPSFPVLQAPSTRVRPGSADDMDLEKKFKHSLDDSEDEADLHALADRIARIRKPGARPQALKRHETV